MRDFWVIFKPCVRIQVCLNWGNATDLSVNLTEQCSGTCNRNVWCMSQRCYARRERSVFAWPPDIKFFRQDLMNYLELMRSGQSLEQGAICPPLLIIQGSGMPKRMIRHTTQKTQQQQSIVWIFLKTPSYSNGCYFSMHTGGQQQ